MLKNGGRGKKLQFHGTLFGNCPIHETRKNNYIYMEPIFSWTEIPSSHFLEIFFYYLLHSTFSFVELLMENGCTLQQWLCTPFSRFLFVTFSEIFFTAYCTLPSVLLNSWWRIVALFNNGFAPNSSQWCFCPRLISIPCLCNYSTIYRFMSL